MNRLETISYFIWKATEKARENRGDYRLSGFLGMQEVTVPSFFGPGPTISIQEVRERRFR